MNQHDDLETSEFQDTQRMFQRLDEASTGTWMCWEAVISGDYSRMDECVNKADIYFGIFRHICKDWEQEPIDQARKELKGEIKIEIRRLLHLKTYAPHLDSQPKEAVIEKIREYILAIGKLREDHKLSTRTKKKIDPKKRVDNATKY
jgi:hypothetical protein